MKKAAGLFFALALLFSLALPNTAAYAKTDGMALYVDGVEVSGYEQPFMSHDQVLIPVENLFNEAGFQVTKEKGIVSASNSYVTVDFNAAGKMITVNGKKANTEFPLTLKNAGNYISGDFLDQLEGFDVTISEDGQSVEVTTNRVQDVEAFLEKTLNAGLNSYSANLVIDQQMETSMEEMGAIDMRMEMDMDFIQEPVAMHMIMKMMMNMDNEKVNETSETYLTKDGYYEQNGDQWVKYDDDMMQGLLQASLQQIDPSAQLELMKSFMKGVHIFEYDDVYVMVQTLTTEQFKEMMEEASALLGGLLPEGILGDAAMEDTEAAEDTQVEELEEGTEQEEELFPEDLAGMLEALNLDIETFYAVSTYDKATFFPIALNGSTKMTMGMDDETISIKQIISGTYSNYNKVKEITIPEKVKKNAISFEEYMEQLEAEFEGMEELDELKVQ